MEIALNTYSLRNEYEEIGRVEGVIKICRDLGISKVEFLDRHFSVASIGWNPGQGLLKRVFKTPQMELSDAISKFKESGIEVFSLGPHVRLLCGPREVDATIKEAMQWIDVCAENGVPMMRGSMSRDAGDIGALWPPPTREMYGDDEGAYAEDLGEYEEELGGNVDAALERISLVLEPVLAHAEKKEVTICQETHHSYSSNNFFMRKVLDKFQTDRYGLAYDFGNYENDPLRWAMLDSCGVRVKYWHAKCYTFDDAGFETTLDYPRAITMSAQQGFDGMLSIEFEGKYNGVLGTYQTVELLNYCLAKLDGREYSMKTDHGTAKSLMAKYAS